MGPEFVALSVSIKDMNWETLILRDLHSLHPTKRGLKENKTVLPNRLLFDSDRAFRIDVPIILGNSTLPEIDQNFTGCMVYDNKSCSDHTYRN